MAIYPCDWLPHRFPQPQQSVYVSSVRPDSYTTWKLRFCPKHFSAYLDLAQELTKLVEDDSQPSDECDRCGKEKSLAVYLKFFPSKAEPFYYASDLCGRCWPDVGKDLKVSNGSIMPALSEG
jgi:hypothetical protein